MSVVTSGAGERLRVLDDDLSLLLRSTESPARMSVMTVEVAVGSGVPPHTHRAEEEGYFVLEGELSFRLGERDLILRPGDFVHVPPRTVHGYRNASAARVRFLAWTVGGPVDEFFVDMSQKVRSMPADAPIMAGLMRRYGIEMMGGPPR